MSSAPGCFSWDVFAGAVEGNWRTKFFCGVFGPEGPAAACCCSCCWFEGGAAFAFEVLENKLARVVKPPYKLKRPLVWLCGSLSYPRLVLPQLK